ncbi:uncharacterized protein LOC123868036 [Maniola jurtina]|uniref:uncharacterized protein LOC123868036 n=1 Tax=Maniola jurtina TaxID=191418 RepID=UPI001E68A8C0|nr:uncharacterized protein LOC123868036 [Maniola jurtina]
MRTSAQQFEQLVNFMERHGDLNKPADGPHGRIRAIQMWEDLTNLLNLDVSGDHKSIDKWKKVWSDFKNNTKRKAAKIQQASASGGSATKLAMSELEQRVLRIVQAQGPASMAEEYVVPNNEWTGSRLSTQNALLVEKPFDASSKSDEDIKVQNLGRSGHSTPIAWEMSVSPAASPAPAGRSPRSPRARRVYRRHSALRRGARAPEDRIAHILRVFANESLRLRRRELEQQAQWQSLFGKMVDVLNKFLNK